MKFNMKTKEEQEIKSLKKIAIYKNLDKALRDLIDIIQFTENVSLKIHGLLEESKIFEVLKEEFFKSKRYASSISLLDNDGSKLKIVMTTISPKKLKLGEKIAGFRLKNYQIDLKKSRTFKQVVSEGRTLRVKVKSIIAEMFSLPTTFLISKLMGYQNKESILTPLYKQGKIIGAFAMTSVDLAEYFIPSVKNLARHISESLELADEHLKHRKAEMALRESEEKLRSIFFSCPDAICITDLNGKIIDCNQACLAMSGLSTKKEIIGKSAFNWIVPRDRQKAKRNMLKTLTQGFVKNLEYNLLTKNGHEFPIELSASLVRDSSGKPFAFMAIIKDITERKKIDQAKTEFVSLASHQLRTPLTTINWYTELLLTGDIGKVDGEQKKYLKEIHTSNQRLVKLVNSLLNVSRIDVGSFSIEPEPVNFTEIADSVLSDLLPKIKQKGLIIKNNYSKALPKISADPKLVQIILQNLLSNAVKYTSVRGRINIAIKKEKSDVLIKVSDTGFGIPKNQQSKIFTKFFRADNAKEKDPDGTGLGLYITKSIIEKSGGKIWFESEEEKGTTFYVKIPLSGMEKKMGRKELTLF